MSAPAGSRSVELLKRFNTLRGRALAGGLLLVFVLWTTDQISHTPGPKTARAVAAASGAHIIPDPPDRAMIEEFLADGGELPETVMAIGLRDPFQEAVLAPRSPPKPGKDESGLFASDDKTAFTEPPAPEEPAKSHRLQGVMLGPKPIALIDDKPYRLGDRIGSYRIHRIDRDSVELRRGSSNLLLRLEQPRLGQPNELP